MPARFQRPSAVNLKNVEDFAQYMDALLGEVEMALNESSRYTEQVKLHREPAKKTEGLTVLADGSDWNPGDGEGLYRWNGSAWVKVDNSTTTVTSAAVLADDQFVVGAGGARGVETVTAAQARNLIGLDTDNDVTFAGLTVDDVVTDTLTLNGLLIQPAVQLLASGSVSSAATLDLVLTSYTAYRGIIVKLYGFLPVTDGASFWIRFSTDGGSTFDATGYNYAANACSDSSGAFVANGGSANQIVAAFTVGNASTEGLNGTFEILNQTDAAFWSRIMYQIYMVDNAGTPTANAYVGGGSREAAQDTDAIRLMFSTGNIAAGNYALYGLV